MITFLQGELVESLPGQAVVGVGGVGYLAAIPLSTYDRLPGAGSPVRLLTHLHVREDAHTLYGFLTDEERDLFRLLIQRVSGVGPKVALAVLSGMSVSAFKDAVVREDVASLSAIKGLGRKTAERIVLELKDKVGVVAAWEQRQKGEATGADLHRNDALLALISLGYKPAEASRALDTVFRGGDLGAGDGPEEILRLALRELN